MCRRSTGSSFSPDPGKNSWQLLSPGVVEHGVRHGHHPCESFRPLPGARPYPVAPADGMVIAVEVRRALRRMRWGRRGC